MPAPEPRSAEWWTEECHRRQHTLVPERHLMCPDCARAFAAQETAALQQDVEGFRRENGLQGEQIGTLQAALTGAREETRMARIERDGAQAYLTEAQRRVEALERSNVLKTVSSEWEHSALDGEVRCHSRMIEGVLCRWWGSDEPPGVTLIDKAALRGGEIA